MFPDLEFIKTCLNGLRSQIEKVENWVVSFVRANRPNWEQNDPNALDYVKGRTHYEVNGRVVQLPSKFLPSPTSNTVGAIKADSAKTTDIQPVRLGTDGKLYSSGIPIFTTSGTGSAYTANVPEITELVDGMLVVMIPHTWSTLELPTLNINGLGAHRISRSKSSSTSGSLPGYYVSWLTEHVPVLLMYNSGRWFACNFTKPDAEDLFGTIPVSKGGTNRTTLAKGSYLVGNDTGSVQLKTPSEVLADIGAIPVPATASVGQVIAVKAVDADGKPTEWEAADAGVGVPAITDEDVGKALIAGADKTAEWGDAGGKKLRLIADIAITEDVAYIDINADSDGNPFSLTEVIIYGYTKGTSANGQLRINAAAAVDDKYSLIKLDSFKGLGTMKRYWNARIEYLGNPGNWYAAINTPDSGASILTTTLARCCFARAWGDTIVDIGNNPIGSISHLRILSNTSDNNFAAGSVLRVFGR